MLSEPLGSLLCGQSQEPELELQVADGLEDIGVSRNKVWGVSAADGLARA